MRGRIDLEKNKEINFEDLKDKALAIAWKQGYVSSDDLRQFQITGDKRVIGTALASLVNEGNILGYEYFPTEVPTSHKRPIKRYILTHAYKERIGLE